MSDEIKKSQERAKELGIYEILRNLATQGKNTQEPCEVEWESCKIKFRKLEIANGRLFVTSIKMPDGVVLYRCEECIARKAEQRVTDFRNGVWVERIKAYSEQITLEKQQAAEARAQKKQENALKPFSGIDF